MVIVVVGEGGGVKSGLGTEGWMLVGVVEAARKARRRRRLDMSCGGVGGVEEGLEAAIVVVWKSLGGWE